MALELLPNLVWESDRLVVESPWLTDSMNWANFPNSLKLSLIICKMDLIIGPLTHLVRKFMKVVLAVAFQGRGILCAFPLLDPKRKETRSG